MTTSPEEITRADEVRMKAETIISQIPIMTRMAIGWRDACYVDGYTAKGRAYDVAVKGKVLRANRVLEIILHLNDTYTVNLYKIPVLRTRYRPPTVIAYADDVYGESLGEVCYRLTHNSNEG